MKKLRLLFTERCNKNCEGCCNKNWDLKCLPEVDHSTFKDYDEILITGGEPMLFPLDLTELCDYIVFSHITPKIYIYTAWTKEWSEYHLYLFNVVNGFTITLHTQEDADEFAETERKLRAYTHDYKNKSMRLNIFKGITFPFYYHTYYIVKANMKWIENCPLPKDEIFMKYVD